MFYWVLLSYVCLYSEKRYLYEILEVNLAILGNAMHSNCSRTVGLCVVEVVEIGQEGGKLVAFY